MFEVFNDWFLVCMIVVNILVISKIVFVIGSNLFVLYINVVFYLCLYYLV